MIKRRCPLCGAIKFMSKDRGPKTMFQVNNDWSVEIIRTESDQQIDPEEIFCGACSWKGPLKKLVEGV